MKTNWTYEDIPDQTGRVALVTGANSGLGFHTARGLAARGANVLMACRSLARGEQAAANIRGQLPHAQLAVVQLDLGDHSSIESCAETVRGQCERLDILVNNAGLSTFARQQTAQRHELQFGVNHLGHFALTGRLLPLLLGTPASRVVNVSSLAHRNARLDFNDLQNEGGFSGFAGFGAYAQSKLANLLFTFELQRKLARNNVSTISVAAHPGLSSTNLISRDKLSGDRHRLWAEIAALMARLVIPAFGQSAEQGALPQLYAAAAPEVNGGDYFGPGGWQEFRGSPKLIRASDHAYDEDAARRLWQMSAQLTGETFPPLES